MNIGIISDSHDNLPKIIDAVRVFNKEQCCLVLHLGDYISPFSIPPLDKLVCPWVGIYGNNDGEKKGLLAVSGNKIKKDPLIIDVNKNTGLLDATFHLSLLKNHKKKKGIIRLVAAHEIHDYKASGQIDIVLFGHTHKPEIRQKDKKLFVNPGECVGWLFQSNTVAMIDINRLEARIIRL